VIGPAMATMASAPRLARHVLELGHAAQEPQRDAVRLHAVEPGGDGVTELVDEDAGEQAERRRDAEDPGGGARRQRGGVEGHAELPNRAAKAATCEAISHANSGRTRANDGSSSTGTPKGPERQAPAAARSCATPRRATAARAAPAPPRRGVERLPGRGRRPRGGEHASMTAGMPVEASRPPGRPRRRPRRRRSAGAARRRRPRPRRTPAPGREAHGVGRLEGPATASGSGASGTRAAEVP
jgi:hypothetical protein